MLVGGAVEIVGGEEEQECIGDRDSGLLLKTEISSNTLRRFNFIL